MRAEGFVPVIAEVGEVREGEETAAPDIKLNRGGWISGCVETAGTMPKGLAWEGYVKPKRPDMDSRLLDWETEDIETNFTFRIGPLAPGTYSLTALMGNYDLDQAVKGRRWTGESGRVQVRVGQETKGVVIPVCEAKRP